MYLSKDREQAPKSSKKMIIAATAGLAVAGVATVSYMNQSDTLNFTQLASAPQLGDQFYNNINKGCDEWYVNASKLSLQAQDAFLPQAKFMWEHKLLLTKYGRESYHRSMGQFIDQIEALTDSQRDIENHYAYTDKYLAKVGEKLSSDEKWRVALKWSTKVSNACV